MPKDMKATVTIKGPVGYRYTGNGAFFDGLPTHDIVGEVTEDLAPAMVRAIQLGLYEPIYEESTDAQSD